MLQITSPKELLSVKQIEFEIELDRSWTLRRFLTKVREDILRSRLVIKDKKVLD